METFREYLEHHIVIGDGAMATLLYQHGIPVNSCYEHLNVTRPDVVQQIHRSYLDAGATLLTTNTFGAHRDKLSRYGLTDQLDAINRHGVRLAREVAQGRAYVVGSIGPIRAGRQMYMDEETLRKQFSEQATALLTENPDGLILETFLEAEELFIALDVIRPLTDIPMICQLSIQERDTTLDGYRLDEAFRHLMDAGADVIGLNCRVGPYGILRALEQVHVSEDAILSAFPNAGLPELVDGEYVYQSTPEYFGDSARIFQKNGVRVIGGCCGTTPAHISAIAKAVGGLTPAPIVPSVQQQKETSTIIVEEPPTEETLVDLVKKRHTVIVELDPPKDLNIEPFIEGAKALKQAGADAITLADNSLATTRMSNMALGRLIKEQIQIRPLLHMACRDRNLIGQQSHLMGLYALGLDHVLAVTGDPSRFGDTPGASSVFDHTSFDLIRMIKQLNEGISYSGKPLQRKANFVVGAAFNPNVRHLDAAIRRLEKKVEAGADFIMTQPVYDMNLIEEIYQATKHLPIPIFIGIMPLVSARNAEFLHNEVPGISLPLEVRQRMAAYEGERAREEGIAIASELLEQGMRFFHGIYLMTPFMRYEMTVELCKRAVERAYAAEKM
ncbi:bifunctional homocysteine S-methyltransferase/5,10-methylenetetrahydrofolate reductase [Collibacillus ludicampi]|uniref:Bifunctional homocysteine S-methyltransferase/5,10-methylenetetrahydrofolate reductase n=1 Tax=Collibacillus ludicampi TaxID=2771369 RepID=A0AAV4LFZ8_9BACL|nr:bifunctional homocysteine S-methyltransferase/methylenetetrahydrofolate reductase [Collibacillus ludicampi]GIM46710.1 bifunctional homocysteine S-methyltransferase/5,10-methylenetetrahydrofolate reductase [Collibacillus ludicampi]